MEETFASSVLASEKTLEVISGACGIKKIGFVTETGQPQRLLGRAP